tara:strand:- start:313 stop:1275 length:963 start_codon:yes stop_codon:yes gene_type:complete
MEKLYPWLSDLWQEWQSSLKSGRFSNASMLVTQPGLGAEQLVDHFSRAVMCSNYEHEACGFCHSCQLMQSNSHPDFHFIKPEKEGKAISVEQIRQCNRQAQESSQLGGIRLFVIEPAEAMNESAANALLKTLEEPSGNCMFLLVAHRSNGLLPTITSRCQQWHLTLPGSESVANWIKEHVQGTVPLFAAHLNSNAPLSTLKFIEQGKEKEYLKLEQQFQRVAERRGDCLALAKALSSEASETLYWIWYLLTDAQKVHFGVEEAHFVPGAKPLADSVEYDLLYQQASALSLLIEQLREHPGLNSELLILDWLFKFNGETCL